MNSSLTIYALLFSALLGVNIAQSQTSSAPTSSPGVLSQQQIQNLIRKAAANDQANDKRLNDYTYTERVDEHKLDGKGHVKSDEVKTYEILEIYGEPVQRLVAKDEKPLSGKDAEKEEEKIQKLIDKRKNESAEDRSKREGKEEKDREQDREFVNEVADAYNFRLIGTEQLDSRDNYVIDAEPRTGFQPHTRDAKMLPHFHFRVWIDKQEEQWTKLDVTCIDNVSFGLFLARLHKGAHIELEQTRVNDEVWLPQHVSLKADLRLALLKDYNVEQDVTFRDYKKYRSTTKIIPGQELSQQ